MASPRVGMLWQADAMRRSLALALLACVAACGTPDQRPGSSTAAIAVTPPGERADAPVVRRELPDQPIPPVASIAPSARPAPPTAPATPVVVPADAIYVCVVDQGGTRHQTVIEFVPKVHQLCRRHPEMGPCQYERNVCRSAGGRVFAAGGQEITMATEAEYDRKVMRVRFRAN
jgi:hypothetical protein